MRIRNILVSFLNTGNIYASLRCFCPHKATHTLPTEYRAINDDKLTESSQRYLDGEEIKRIYSVKQGAKQRGRRGYKVSNKLKKKVNHGEMPISLAPYQTLWITNRV